MSHLYLRNLIRSLTTNPMMYYTNPLHKTLAHRLSWGNSLLHTHHQCPIIIQHPKYMYVTLLFQSLTYQNGNSRVVGNGRYVNTNSDSSYFLNSSNALDSLSFAPSNSPSASSNLENIIKVPFKPYTFFNFKVKL